MLRTRAAALSLFTLATLACGTARTTSKQTPRDTSVQGALDGGPLTISQIRERSAATADIGLLDSLQQDLSQLAGAAAQARVDRFVSDVEGQGGTPLVSHDGGTRVAFFVQGSPSSGFAVTGTFNAWQTANAPAMTAVSGNLYAVTVDGLLQDAGLLTYKLLDGTTYFEDFHAHNVVWDGIDHQGVGQFNAVANPAALDAGHGRLVAWRGVQDATLGLSRDVFIYIPAAYDSVSAPTLPVLYFHDGNESLTRSPFTFPVDTEYAAHPDEAALQIYVALPNQDLRISQYTFDAGTWDSGAHGLASLPVPQADLYTRFLTDELRPKVTSAFRTCTEPNATGIAGASLGGLISIYAAYRHPEVFGFVGSQSGSVFWGNNALTTYFQSSSHLPLRFYVDTGCPDDNCSSNEPFEQALTALQYPLSYIEQSNGQHDWPYWQSRLPGLLKTFRSGQSDCR